MGFSSDIIGNKKLIEMIRIFKTNPILPPVGGKSKRRNIRKHKTKRR